MWRRSGSRLLLHGGYGNVEAGAEGDLGGPPSAQQGRPQEVYGAFAAFRARRCQPCAAALEAGSGGGAASKAGAAAGKGGGGGGGGGQLGLGQQAALAERLIAAGEALHILRPVVYALALRR